MVSRGDVVRKRSHVAIIDRALANEFECNCEKHRS